VCPGCDHHRAGRGLGRAHALAFAREGARLVINDTGAGRDDSGGDHGPADAVAAEVREPEAQHRAALADRLGL
jgi:NAD(P)-dependent dehydrogenase (short-subunit alcohol dehydrogenase family)